MHDAALGRRTCTSRGRPSQHLAAQPLGHRRGASEDHGLARWRDALAFLDEQPGTDAGDDAELLTSGDYMSPEQGARCGERAADDRHLQPGLHVLSRA